MQDLTTGSVTKKIFFFALPMLIGNVFQQLYQTVDSIIVGKALGKEFLAGVGTSFPILFLLIALLMGIGMGGTIMVSQYYGARDMVRVKKAIDTTFFVLIWGAVFLSILGILLAGPILKLLQTPADVFPHALIYIQIIFGGLVLLAGYNSVGAVLRGLGDSRTPLYFLIVATVVNIGLDLLFILVFKWGIVGAAVATVIAQGVSFIGGVIYLNLTHDVLKLRIFKMEFDPQIFKESIRIGLPAGIQQVFVAVAMIALVGLVNSFGTDAIAAYTAAGRIDSFAVMPAMMFAMALSTFVGQNLGAGKHDRVKQGLKATLMMSTIVSIIVTTLVIIFRNQLISIFLPSIETAQRSGVKIEAVHLKEVLRIGGEYLIIIGSFYIVFNTMFIINAVMRGAGDTIVPMIITIAVLLGLRFPIGWILSRYWGTRGIWWGTPVSWTVGMITSFIYYRIGRWQKKGLVHKPGSFTTLENAEITADISLE